MAELLTIGYEGSSIDDFIATLKLANVDVLLDVRDIPLSRKKGFSKKALTIAIESAGLKYIHLKALGDPKPGREAARRGEFDAFRRIFNAHMKTEASQSALDKVIDLVGSANVCLLCFERDHACCHRSIVADAVVSRKQIKVRHLGVKMCSSTGRTSTNHANTRELAYG